MLKRALNTQFKRYFCVKPSVESFEQHTKAWQIHSFGGISDLQLSTHRTPHITYPSEVLIKVEASSVNPIDVVMTSGYGSTIFKALKCTEPELPLTLGRDFAGTIIDKGMGVGNDLKVGDKVYGIVPLHKQGCHAEAVIVDYSHVLPRPEAFSPVESASVLYASMTAWSALWITGDLALTGTRGKKVLVLGASGGVGTAAVQMLKANSAFVVGTCSTDAVPLVEKLGADVVLDYKDPNYLHNVASVAEYDIILDCAKFGVESVPEDWRYTRYITLNSPLMTNTDAHGLLPGLARSAFELLAPNAKLVPKGRSWRWAYFMPVRPGLEFVDRLFSQKQIMPIIQETFPFSKTPSAYERVKEGHLRGKVVINLE